MSPSSEQPQPEEDALARSCWTLLHNMGFDGGTVADMKLSSKIVHRCRTCRAPLNTMHKCTDGWLKQANNNNKMCRWWL